MEVTDEHAMDVEPSERVSASTGARIFCRVLGQTLRQVEQPLEV